MKLFVICIFVVLITVSYSAPIGNIEVGPTRDAKSSFGPAFDEIVVESTLQVKRKNPLRKARTQDGSKTEGIPASVTEDKKKPVKRQARFTPIKPIQPIQPIKPITGSLSSGGSQAQAFNSFGPVANFGASATGANTQSVSFGPGGISGSAGFSGTQQYNLPNGQTVDISFGNAFSGAGSKGGKGNAQSNGVAVSITGLDGKKRPLKG